MTTFGDRFKQLRLEKGLTQNDIATVFYLKNSHISKYENNVHMPEIPLLQRFADFFDVSTDYLLCRIDTKHIPPGLTSLEYNLINKFRTLDNDLQQEVLEYIDFRCSSKKRQKLSTLASGENKADSSAHA